MADQMSQLSPVSFRNHARASWNGKDPLSHVDDDDNSFGFLFKQHHALSNLSGVNEVQNEVRVRETLEWHGLKSSSPT